MWLWMATAHAHDGCPTSLAGLTDDPRAAAAVVIVVEKAARRAGVYRAGSLVPGACYRVALAPDAPDGHKQRRGDRRTPEGWYRTSDRPWSAFYHALTVSYPGPADAERGLRDGLVTQAQAAAIHAAAAADRLAPEDTALGGQILLHGGGSSGDWTLGCVGFDDADIDAVRAMLPSNLRADVWLRP